MNPPAQHRYRTNILLVDDRHENLELLIAVLGPLEQNLVLANSGEEALKCLLRQDFALILLDVRMPGMDGFETAAHIKSRERTRSVPIIFLTALDSDPFHSLRGYSEGAVDYISKPFDPWMLRSKVVVFIQLDAKNRELRDQAIALSAINEKLMQLAAKAEAASAAKSTFLNLAGHELRTPLTVISGYTELIVAGAFGNVPEPMLRPVSVIEAKVDELAALVESILTAARMESEIMPTVPIAVNLNKLVAGAMGRVQGRVALLDGGLTFEPSPDDVSVMVDVEQMSQVFDNLMNNALSYGGATPWVRVCIEHDENAAGVVIEDHGGGVAIEDQERIFERFVRGEEASFDTAANSRAATAPPSPCARVIPARAARSWSRYRSCANP